MIAARSSPSEEHQIMGGWAPPWRRSWRKTTPCPWSSWAVRDRFGQSGEPNELIEFYGMGSKDVVKAVKAVLKRK